MARLQSIVSYLDTYLRLDEIPDYPGSHNGLQVTNDSGAVRRVAAAVDACLPVVEEAVKQKAQLLLVHHGLFWGGVQCIRGSVFRKLKLAMDNDLAIYSAHIPLDVHPHLGNNVLLAEALGLTKLKPFLPWKGITIGVRSHGKWTRGKLLEKVRSAVGGGEVHLAPGGPAKVRHVGIVTGGAGSEIAAAAAEGVDTFITGEGPHHTYTLAEELGVNLIYAGHYATETFGVEALAQHVAERFETPHLFVDHPTGL